MRAQTNNKINNNKRGERPNTRKTMKTSATHLGMVVSKFLKIMTWLLLATNRILLTPFKKMTTSSLRGFYYQCATPLIILTKKITGHWTRLVENKKSEETPPGFQTRKTQRKKPRNNEQKLRHWKTARKKPWTMSFAFLGTLYWISAISYSMNNLYYAETNERTYYLTQNALPIQRATMTRSRSNTKRIYKAQHRKNKTLREWREHITNLRFDLLRQTTKTIMGHWSNVLTVLFISSTIPKWKAYGPKTFCPWCAIPIIGLTAYLKQNFKNLTKAMKSSTTYLGLMFNTLKIMTWLLDTTSRILLTPFKKMTKHRKARRRAERNRKRRSRNIGQYDGNQDLDDSDWEDSFTSIDEGNYGWTKKPTEVYPKGTGYWYNPNRPPTKQSKLENAPEMRPPDRGGQDKQNENKKPETPEIPEDQGVSDEEEINITLSETGRTKVLTINVRSAVSDTKQAQIKLGIKGIDPDVIIITETWFNKYDQEFRVDNYIPIGREDRPTPRNQEPKSNKRGGGVLVLAKKDIDITEVLETSLHRDIQIVRFVMDRTTVYGIYRTGKKLTHELLTDWLDTEITKLDEKPYIITGDLNLPGLAKVNFAPILQSVGSDKRKRTPAHMWADLVKKHGIDQLVEKPTQRKGNILDYIFVPINVTIPDIRVDRSAFDTNFDHYAVIFEVDSYYQRKKEESHKRKESPATWKKFKEILRETDFMGQLNIIKETLGGQEAIDKMSSFIITTIRKIYEDVTPLVLSKPPPIKGFLSKVTLRALAHAKRLYRTLVKSQEDEKKPYVKEKLKQINKANRWMIRQDRIAWEFRRLHLSKERGDDFYRFMSELTRKTMTLGPIKTPEGQLISGDREMAEAFNDYLCDLMQLSTKADIDWDTPFEAKDRQLHVVGIPGSEARVPMENDQVRNHIVKIHQELAEHGYELSVEDIIDSYPLGMQARGKKAPPIVLTYKDEKTMEDVKQAAIKAGLWNRRQDRKEEPKKTSIASWMKRLVSKLGVTIESLFLSGEKKEKQMDHFTAAYVPMNSIHMTTKEIKLAIRKTKRTSAPGPDGLRMSVYAEACSQIVRPLQVLYNAINANGNIPTNFKTARVILLHKKNSKQDMANYRPISMANHISKIWERVLNARLIQHLNRHNMLTRHQHGFRPKRGCHTNLLEAWDKIIEKTDKHGPTIEVWSFDLQKAFDLLDHGKALSLCHKAGIGGNVGRSLENWLTSRTQYVQCGKEMSKPRIVNRSCVQGSVLGPTLWLIYVQSLLDRLETMGCDHYAYADDVAIVAKISTTEEIKSFNDVLETLLKWGRDFGMKWGAHKTQRLAMRYQNCGDIAPPDIYFDGKLIPPTDTIVSLGVTLNKGCIPYTQHENVESSIKTMKILIAKGFRIRDQAILERLYTTYILPRINYCSQLYHTGQLAHLRDLEKELGRFWNLCDTKMTPKGVLELTDQLIFNDLKFMHKIRHGLSPIDFDEFFTISDLEKTTNEKITPKPFKHAFAKHSFFYRIHNYWNYLPVAIRNLKPEPFKVKIKSIFTDEKWSRHRQNLLNFGLDTPISGPPDDTPLT